MSNTCDKRLYFYKLVSDYPEDTTKNCKLTINEIDSNFENLKNADISAVTFDSGNLIITLNCGDTFVAQIDERFSKNLTYDFDASVTSGENGTNLVITYSDSDGSHTTEIFDIITADILPSAISGAIHDVNCRIDEIDQDLQVTSGKGIDASVDYYLNASSLVNVSGETVYNTNGYNLILKSKDNKPENFIKIKMISDFGEI